MVEAPPGDALVRLDESVARAHEVREHREEPPEDDHAEGQCQREPGRDLGVQSPDEQPSKP